MNIQYPVFVINMDKDLNRWASVQDQAKRYGLNIKRVPAVESKDMPENELELVTAGVRAVWKSHMKCMQLLLESEFNHAIVAEDDFSIIASKDLFSALLDKDLLSYDLIQIGWVIPGIDNRIKRKYADIEHFIFRMLHRFLLLSNPKSKHLNRLRVRSAGCAPKGFVSDDFQPGGHFYMVSRKFAHAILKINEPQFLATDDLYIALARMRSRKFIRSKKNFVTQKPFEKWSGSRFSNH